MNQGYPVPQQQQGGQPPPPAPPAASAPKKYDGKDGMPLYAIKHGGHYGASAAISASGHAPPPETFSGHWANVSQGLTGSYRDILNTYWQQVVSSLENDDHDYKIHNLPLARIKKVMKADPEVKMISAEAPIIFAKACETFITELTMRAWIHAEENKRRTLQRSDIAAALAKSDMFDFLIDIVPREDATPQHKRRPEYAVPEAGGGGGGGEQPVAPQQVSQAQQEFMAQQHQQQQPEQQHVPQQYYQQQPPAFDPGMYYPQQPGPMGGEQGAPYGSG